MVSHFAICAENPNGIPASIKAQSGRQARACLSQVKKGRNLVTVVSPNSRVGGISFKNKKGGDAE